MTTESPATLRRALHVLAVIAAGVAGIGYVAGTRPLPPVTDPIPPIAGEIPSDGLRRVPSYAELGSDDPGRIGERQRTAFGVMLRDRPALTDELPVPDEAARLASLEARAQNRAFDGAPPRIPHPITQMEVSECASCHGDGVRITAGLTAPAMSHEPYASCTQCHVVDEAPMPNAELALRSGPPIDSTFIGLEAPQRGPRAYEGAPPQIPHPTRMREVCGSCHGTLAEGLRTSHPWRQSCTQCHAPSAEFDQGPDSALGPIGAPR